MTSAYETVIGLEVHVQLATCSKLFSGSATQFGAEANTQANGYDLALPGTLPVLNEEVLRMAVKFGLAIDAEIGKKSAFDRKNYFYPDLPKGYQISQLSYPTVGKGSLSITLDGGDTKVIGITRAHLEEDAGKSLHEDFHGMSGIDLNRAGTPLLEVVSEPELRSAAEAVAYLKKLHSLVRYLGISDAIMAQGSLRCDANVSVREKGQTEFGMRTEIKNINSFRFVEKAIDYEAQRHIDIIEGGGTVVRETLLYDSGRNETRAMRSKEVDNDYRYFPEPDLLPVVIDDAYIETVRKTLPELPDARRQRFVKEYKLSEYDADVLVADRATAEYYEQVAELSGDAKLAANWVSVELQGMLNKLNLEIADSPVEAQRLGTLVARVKDGTISGKIAKSVFETMLKDGAGVDDIIAAKGLKQVTDQGELEQLAQRVIDENPTQAQQYRDGKEQVLGFLVGQAMKLSGGKANPAQINQLLRDKIK
ncbi:MAG: Asp-tRNA(Asn)/Glu-tRNA(Gln) amidotransferase subunit GatB [Pseudohongiellaceae bacterium]